VHVPAERDSAHYAGPCAGAEGHVYHLLATVGWGRLGPASRSAMQVGLDPCNLHANNYETRALTISDQGASPRPRIAEVGLRPQSASPRGCLARGSMRPRARNRSVSFLDKRSRSDPVSDVRQSLDAVRGAAAHDTAGPPSSKFVQRHGHARVSQSHTVGGYQLGTWVDRQRRFHADGTLEADRERVSGLRICGISGYLALTWKTGAVHTSREE
jgi:hypothetical protein